MAKITLDHSVYANIAWRKVVRYPDGIDRMLSMPQWYWDRAEDLNKDGIPFEEILAGAIQLAKEFPSHRGFEEDIHHDTRVMIRGAYISILESKITVSNDNSSTR